MRVARQHRYKAPDHPIAWLTPSATFSPHKKQQQQLLALRWFFFNENQMLLGTAKSCPCVGVQLSAALGRRKCATAIVRAGVAREGAGRAEGKAAMASVLVKSSSL